MRSSTDPGIQSELQRAETQEIDNTEKNKRTYLPALFGSLAGKDKDASGKGSIPSVGLRATWRTETDNKVVGLKNMAIDRSMYEKRHRLQPSAHSRRSYSAGVASMAGKDERKYSVEEMEASAREKAIRNPLNLLYLGNLAAMKVMLYYMITLETILSCGLTVGLTLYWYYAYPESSDWNGGGMDFVLLAFALTAPISTALGMAFNRRERALITIADFRSFSYHLYLAHSLWDWEDDKGGRANATLSDGVLVDWLEHTDAVLAQLIGIGDELSRFLSLPTTSRSRHRMTKSGRREAARTIEVAYLLLESMSTQRMTRLLKYSERLKKIGLPSGEISRVRQYERFLSSSIEQLRMIKMYRTPQSFRSFARIFTLILPPFYAPTYAQVGREVNSIGVGIAFGIITALGLTALFESLQILEDPFTAFLALDGVDVPEEFEVLHYAQLTNTRKLLFPDAPPYPVGRRAALTGGTRWPSRLGLPPQQIHHRERVISEIPVELDSASTIYEPKPDDSVASPDFDEEGADVELGLPMDEEVDNITSLRATAFLDTTVDEPRGLRHALASQNSLTHRSRHQREWSRGG